MIKMREVYEIRGYDFALCCGINSMYDLEFGNNLVQRLSGLVNLEIKIDKGDKPLNKKTDARIKSRTRLRKWKGNVYGLEDVHVTISEVRNYLTRVSLDFKNEDSNKLEEVRAILSGIRIGKKSFLDFRKKHEEVKPEISRDLGRCGMYSSD
jgi:hypothetical protein